MQPASQIAKRIDADTDMADSGDFTELAEAIVSDNEEGEERTKKVDRMAKKLSNQKVKNVARAICKKVKP